MKNRQLFFFLVLIFILLPQTYAQAGKIESFEQIEILYPNNKKVSVKVMFLDSEVQIVNKKGGSVLKTFKYTDINSAEYSFSRSPRWREGLAFGAAGILFPPLWLVALPMGFTKTQHHWLTFQSASDYVVLKVNKRVKRLFIPSFETHTGVKVEALGDSK